MKFYFLPLFLFVYLGMTAQSSQLTVTTYPSCPDARKGSASILLWSILYENLIQGGDIGDPSGEILLRRHKKLIIEE